MNTNGYWKRETQVYVPWLSFLSVAPFELAALEIKGSMDICKQRKSTYKMMCIRN